MSLIQLAQNMVKFEYCNMNLFILAKNSVKFRYCNVNLVILANNSVKFEYTTMNLGSVEARNLLINSDPLLNKDSASWTHLDL
jgi:hypothetical protein